MGLYTFLLSHSGDCVRQKYGKYDADLIMRCVSCRLSEGRTERPGGFVSINISVLWNDLIIRWR